MTEFERGFHEELEKIAYDAAMVHQPTASAMPTVQPAPEKKKPGLLKRTAKGALIGGAVGGIPTGGALALPGAAIGALGGALSG